MEVPTNPKRPYLLRAMHEWMTENGQTPHLVADADFPGVQVPRQHVQDGKIILNVGYPATRNLDLGNKEISFGARFRGSPFDVRIPVEAVLGIYARESGEGIIFSDEDSVPRNGEQLQLGGETNDGAVGKPHLRVIK